MDGSATDDDARDMTAKDVAGRALVRECLVRRLAEAGLRRPRGTSAAQHDAMMERLVVRLAYMSRANLEQLAESVLDAAGGPQRDICPSEVVIRNWAEGLQKRPWRDLPIVRSWLASVEGPKAEMGGYLVPLLRFLRAKAVPPTPWDMKRIMEQAAEDQRMQGLVQDRMARGVASADDLDWRAAQAADAALAREIVADGAAHRAARGAAA